MKGQETTSRRTVLREAGLNYSISAALPVMLALLLGAIAVFAAGEGYEDADWYRFAAFLLPQICFAASSLIWFRRGRVPVRAVYGRCKWQYFLIALALQFGLMFSLSDLNVWFLRLLERLGYRDPGVPLPSLDGWNLLPAMLIIAVLPAVFEETVFRGIMVGGMRAAGWGNAAVVLCSGALFSLFHHNPAQTLYQFVCGVCLALVALRAGSIFPTMAAHFINNAAVLALTATGYETGGANGWTMPLGWEIGLGVASAVCLAASLVYLLFFDRSGQNKGAAMPGGGTFFLFASAGVALCAAQWISMLVTGFLGG